MAIDVEYLKRQYAGMADEVLLEVEREDLTRDARDLYDAEVMRRGLHETLPSSDSETDLDSEDWDVASGIEPDWVEDGALACSFSQRGRDYVAPEVDEAVRVLSAAGLPSFVKVEVDQGVKSYLVIVPARFTYHAMAVLDKEIFNVQFETEYRTHFELLSDEELKELQPQALVAGLVDRVERIKKVFREERSRRGLE